MSVLDLKAFSGTFLLEILVQLANLKVRYHFMNYRRLAIFGPASLVINLHLALLPLDVHLPIGPKQGAFTIHMMRSEPQSTQTTNDVMGDSPQEMRSLKLNPHHLPIKKIWRVEVP